MSQKDCSIRFGLITLLLIACNLYYSSFVVFADNSQTEAVSQDSASVSSDSGADALSTSATNNSPDEQQSVGTGSSSQDSSTYASSALPTSSSSGGQQSGGAGSSRQDSSADASSTPSTSSSFGGQQSGGTGNSGRNSSVQNSGGSETSDDSLNQAETESSVPPISNEDLQRDILEILNVQSRIENYLKQEISNLETQIAANTEALSQSMYKNNKLITVLGTALGVLSLLILVFSILSFSKLLKVQKSQEEALKTESEKAQQQYKKTEEMLTAVKKISNELSEAYKILVSIQSQKNKDFSDFFVPQAPNAAPLRRETPFFSKKDKFTEEINRILKQPDRRGKLYEMLDHSYEALRVRINNGEFEITPSDLYTYFVGLKDRENLYIYPNLIYLKREEYQSRGYDKAFGDLSRDGASTIEVKQIRHPARLQLNADGRSYRLAESGYLTIAQ